MVNLEMLAAAQHEIWSRWMRWMFTQGYFRRTSPESPGNWVMPEEKAKRWLRQMSTEYADLSEEERESDRKVVREHMSQVLDEIHERN